MGPVLRYTLLRLGVLVVVGALLFLVTGLTWVWLLLTVAISAALSYLLLRGPRDAAARSIDDRVQGRRRSRLDERLDADAAAEDADADRG